MANLAVLKVGKVPGMLNDWRNKYNALCDLIGSIEGNLGIDVHIAAPSAKKEPGDGKKAKPKGGKIIIKPKNPLSGSDGLTTSNELHYLDTSIRIDIDGNGVKLLNLATNHYVKMFTTGAVGVHNATNGKEVLISPTDITHDMSIRTISICSGGVSKSMDILASVPY